MRTNLESLKTFTKDELVMRVEKLENSNTRLTSAVQEFLIETKEEFETISISKGKIEFFKQNIEFEMDKARERNKCITTNSHGIE